MRKCDYIFTFLIILICFVSKGWAQSDTTVVMKEISKGKVKIAFGEQTKESVSSSVSAIQGQELVKSSMSNFSSTLYGKLPGLFISQGGGEPGKDLPTLRLRGSNANVLVIIDGFERDMSFLSPEEVESVTVLKDASALAMYGMKGANGVLLITTKRGLNKKGEITFTVQSGLQSPSKTIDVLGAKDYMTLYNKAAANDGLPQKYSAQEISLAGTSPRYPDVNWKDKVLKNYSNVSKANLAVQGGSDFIQYFVNLGFLYNDGMYLPKNPDMNSNANLTRVNVRSNIDVNVSKNTKFSMDLAGNMNKSAAPAYSVGEIWDAIFTLPPNAFNVYNPDGSYGGTSLLLNNPVAMLETSGRNTSIDNFLNAGFKLNQKFDFVAKGLSATLGYVLDNGSNNSDGNWRYFQARQIVPGTGDKYTYYTYRQPTAYNIWSSASSVRNTTVTADVEYNMPEVNGSKLDVLVRYQGDRQYLRNSDLSPYLTANYASRINYAYNQKYLVELAASYFGSDQYKEGSKYGFFPSASLGWVFSNESFMQENKNISFGKIRASYGINGYNRYVNGRYPYNQFYTGGGSFPLGTGWNMFYGIQPGMLANPDLKWEVSKKLNVGLDLEFKNNLTFAFDYYHDKRSDVLNINYNHPSVTGANLPYENIGMMTNSGFDLKLGYSSKGGTINWFAELVCSYFNNTIDEMGESLSAGNLSHLNRTGNSVSSIYGYEVIGNFASAAEIQSSPMQTFGAVKVGDLKYKDQNGDKIIDSRDVTKIGDQVANIDMGLRLGLNYKSFDLEAQLQGQFNRDLNISWNSLYQPFLRGNAATEIALEEGFPAPTLSNLNNYHTSSYWVRSGDFVKLRNIELGYTLPENVVRTMKMDRFRIFVRGVNLLAISKWDYSDPEFTSIGYPPMKTYFFGANINF